MSEPKPAAGGCRPEFSNYGHEFAHVLRSRSAEATVHFAYDTEVARHPCLLLRPQHPILIVRYQFYTTVMAARELAMMRAGVHSALTEIQWDCREAAAEHADFGRCTMTREDRRIAFAIDTHDADGAGAAKMRCSGVEFTARDFAAWRAEARERLPKEFGDQPPLLCDPGLVGLPAGARCFVSRVRHSPSGFDLAAKVSRAGGFYPENILHEGSGDHVNAGQLFDCAMQACHQILDEARMASAGQARCLSGHAQFRKFVELDYPFALNISEVERADDSRTFNIEFRQAGEVCCELRLELDRLSHIS